MAKKRGGKRKGGSHRGSPPMEGAAQETPQARPPEREKRRHPSSKGVRERRKLPNWPVLALAVVGAALAGVLTVTGWLGEALPYCGTGSDCDIVQSSQWSRLLGAPVAFWGLLTYLAIGWIALRLKGVEWHWKASWTLALVGLAISIYLTVISIVELEATCGYCLGSLAVMAALLGVIAYQTPKGLPDFAWPSWLAQTGGVAVVLVVALHLNWSGLFDPAMGEEDPYLRDLAMHLSDQDARFFGAFWCPNCDRQKELFGASARRLPYIECSPNGRNGPPAPICSINGIERFPTWVIDGRKYIGYLPPRELAEYSGFRPPPPEPR